MRDADLQRILEDIERVAAAAEQLQRAGRHSGHSSDAPGSSQQADASVERPGTIANTTRAYLRSSPCTLGIATGLGFLIGCMLTGRPRHRSQRK